MPDRKSMHFDKLYKVWPLVEQLTNNFNRCLLPSEMLSIDESMIKFKGRSSLKQYMPKKPIKRGYKVSMLCDKSGYCLKFDIYVGKTEGKNKNVEGSLVSRVVYKLMNSLEGKNHRLTFDNFFNSVELMESLKKKFIYSVGTLNTSEILCVTVLPDSTNGLQCYYE